MVAGTVVNSSDSKIARLLKGVGEANYSGEGRASLSSSESY